MLLNSGRAQPRAPRLRSVPKHAGLTARRCIPIALVAAALAGCATVASNTRSPQEVAGLKLAGVTVTITPEAKIQWEDGLRLYASSKGVSYPQLGEAVDSAEAKAYVRNALAPKLRRRWRRALPAS